MSQVTAAPLSVIVQLRCAKREVRLRKRVYPRLVAEGKMTPRQARVELAAMHAIVQTLEQLLAAQQLDLFPDFAPTGTAS